MIYLPHKSALLTSQACFIPTLQACFTHLVSILYLPHWHASLTSQAYFTYLICIIYLPRKHTYLSNMNDSLTSQPYLSNIHDSLTSQAYLLILYE